jgi:hypothetical protein
MNSGNTWRVLGLGLAVLGLSAGLAACGGGGDAGAGSASPASGASAQGASPSVSGTPATTVAANNRYSFNPTASAPASGTPLAFSVQNKPAWAAFAADSGQLSGTPSSSDTGVYPNIVISASSSAGSAALPAFSIQVLAANTPATSSSSSSSGGASSSSSSSSSGASSSSGSSSSGAPGASLSAQTATLLNYLTGLAGQNQHILSGQHSSYWDSNPMDYTSTLKSQTGTQPAILGTTLGMAGSQQNGVALSNQWLAAGGIVELSLWPNDPSTGADDNNRNFTFSDVYTPGTALNSAWNSYLDTIASQLKAINGPVLFRPFVELNGNWSWWGAQPTAQFIALYQYTYDYLMHTKGVNNALWIYNVNAGVGNYTAYYPGSSYVDIVSWDSYPPSSSDAAWYNPLAALGKPMILAESGVISASQPPAYAGNNNTLLQTVKTNFPKVVGVVIWCQNWALSQQQGDEAFMSDPAVITLADLPANL